MRDAYGVSLDEARESVEGTSRRHHDIDPEAGVVMTLVTRAGTALTGLAALTLTAATSTSLLAPHVDCEGLASSAVGEAQRTLLTSLLSPERLARLDSLRASGGSEYGSGQLIEDLSAGLLLPGEGPPAQHLPLRRSLESFYLERLRELGVWSGPRGGFPQPELWLPAVSLAVVSPPAAPAPPASETMVASSM